MTPHLRLRGDLLERIACDLHREHEFASERVGFVCGRATGDGLVVGYDYVPLEDDEYLDDGLAAASFSGAAIRRIRQRALDTGDSIFHVHEHAHHGEPWFSAIDLRSLRQVVPAIARLAPDAPHGALLLSQDAVAGTAWKDGRLDALDVTVVKYPLVSWRPL